MASSTGTTARPSDRDSTLVAWATDRAMGDQPACWGYRFSWQTAPDLAYDQGLWLGASRDMRFSSPVPN